MGVLTHLDGFKDQKKLKKTKKALKHRFWAEIYQGQRTVIAKYVPFNEPFSHLQTLLHHAFII